jgi:K+/H+ antiporter YhaU regulatory subunit KhtT
LSLTPITLRRGGRVTINPGPDERLETDDELVLIGQDEKLERLEG